MTIPHRRAGILSSSSSSRQLLTDVSIFGRWNSYTNGSKMSLNSASEDEVEQAKKLFWESQAKLAASMKGMTEEEEAALKQEQQDKYEKRVLALISDSVFFSVIIFSILWYFFANPFVAASYAFGATMGTAYSYGLAKYVQVLGGSADDMDSVEGAGVGQARFAFLILLFVIVGKFRSQGLLEIPSIAGFFTYQLASLNQGLKQIDD